MPAQIKYNRQGHPYYDYGVGGQVDAFAQSFVQGMQIAQSMKDHEEVRRQNRRQEREAYDRLSPEQQKEKIAKLTAQDLVDLGLVVPASDAVIPQGPVEQGDTPLQADVKQYSTGKGPFKKNWVLRKDAVRDYRLDELAANETNKVIVANAAKAGNLDMQMKEAQVAQMSLDLKRGNFLLSAETEDRATKQRYLDSGIPLYMAVALGQPVAAVQEQQLRDKYPDAAGLRDQETFNFGPHAKELGAQKNLMDARKMFPDWRDANAYAEAYTEAMYDGKYDKIRALKPSMKTFAMAQLDQEGQRLALEKERIAQTETHFIESQAQNLVNGSGWTLGMDTAKQYVRKTAYGDKVAPMSPEAVKEVEKWKGSVEATQQSAAATAYYELQIKQGKAQSEAREGLRSSLKTLIDMHKELGGKALETQMIAVKDELIKKEAADLGIDLSASNGNFWRDAIWNAAKSSMGVGQLSAAAATDAAKSNVSVSGAIAKDVIASVARHTLGQENIQRLATGQDMEGEQYADLGKILNQVFNVVTDPEGQSTLFSLSGTELGNKLQSAMKAVPGFRVAYQENLKAVLAQYKVEAEASNDPMVKDDRHMKMREIMKVLEGMGVK